MGEGKKIPGHVQTATTLPTFYPRKPFLSKLAKGFVSELLHGLRWNGASRKPCEGTGGRWEEQEQGYGAGTHTPRPPDGQAEVHTVREG